ncbi:hypothetical protein HETIRDRAFT_315174 [Heterobasidion irregulare TC 32-1]|uniref:Uncharacterized protein n=1 Tax=Heterobasidion irregulare (strain TC 32-1) TaxID=747525 RepID=W4KBR0_HETIT|nr:uncharacterized protein HETIRDRAFT_315174 [Heterobasidion irregulare TC 32-1]ETW82511.1 hypothetical protein HETIRDRAFT_315174 [Heterobasidion irregulare TC 32-1]
MGALCTPILEYKTFPVLFGILTKRNRPSIKEMKADGLEEPRRPTTMEHTLAEMFNNEMEHPLLLVDFVQTRAQILKTIDELAALTWKLKEIASGLNPSSKHGMH